MRELPRTARETDQGISLDSLVGEPIERSPRRSSPLAPLVRVLSPLATRIRRGPSFTNHPRSENIRLRWWAVTSGVRGRDQGIPRGDPPASWPPNFALVREQKTRQHREITRDAAYKGFVFDDFPPNRVALHFCHPALDFSACVGLLPVKALAAPHGAGHVAYVRRVKHRAPNALLISHQSRGPGASATVSSFTLILRNRHWDR